MLIASCILTPAELSPSRGERHQQPSNRTCNGTNYIDSVYSYKDYTHHAYEHRNRRRPNGGGAQSSAEGDQTRSSRGGPTSCRSPSTAEAGAFAAWKTPLVRKPRDYETRPWFSLTARSGSTILTASPIAPVPWIYRSRKSEEFSHSTEKSLRQM